MRINFVLALVLSAAVVVAGPLSARVVARKTLFHSGAWLVKIIGYDDGAIYCEAKVSYPSNTFAIWARPGRNAQLQFYDSGWKFSKSRADVRVRIDRRPRWNLTNARLSGHSVFFTLPDGNASRRFLREVMYGNTVRLYNRSGSLIHNYSLAGSNASILALTKCVKLLKTRGQDKNPFN